MLTGILIHLMQNTLKAVLCFCSIQTLCDGSLSIFSRPKQSSLDSMGVMLLAILPGNIKWLSLQLIPWWLGNSPLEILIMFMPDVSQKVSSSWNCSEKGKEFLVCSVKAE